MGLADVAPGTYEGFLYRILSKGDPGRLQFASARCTSTTVATLSSGVRVSELIVGVPDQFALCEVLSALYNGGQCLLAIEQVKMP